MAQVDWAAYRKRIAAEIAEMREFIKPFETGQCAMRERRVGEDWRDITQKMVEREHQGIQALEDILAAIDKRLNT